MTLYAAIDLHSNNNFLVVIDPQDRVVFRRKHSNVLSVVLQSLEPFREELNGIVVESTFNWYWLVDGLMEAGWKVHLAHTAGNEQYAGLKYSNDWSDAEWLAHLLRMGLLAEGHIYPKAERGLRDLGRERLRLVQERTMHLLSLEGWMSRQTGHRLGVRLIREMNEPAVGKIHGASRESEHAIRARLAVLRVLDEQIAQMEKRLSEQLKPNPDYERLQTVWGVGKVLARTILLESGPINRFPQEGNYLSYCRMVESRKMSNGKKKGEANRKCGNRYLCWAFMEAAHFACRYYPQAKSFVDRKAQRGKRVLGLKALASKLSRATYFVLRDQVEFDPMRLFGSTSGSKSENRAVGVGQPSRQV
jgi:transposase